MTSSRCPSCGASPGTNPACATCRQHAQQERLEDLAVEWIHGRGPRPSPSQLSKDWLAPVQGPPQRPPQPNTTTVGRAPGGQPATASSPPQRVPHQQQSGSGRGGSVREATNEADRSGPAPSPAPKLAEVHHPRPSSSYAAKRRRRHLWLYAFVIGFLVGMVVGFRWASHRYEQHIAHLRHLITTQQKWLQLETERRLALELRLGGVPTENH